MTVVLAFSGRTGAAVDPRPNHAVWFDLSWHGSKIVAEHEVPDGEPIAACAHCGGGIYVVAYKSD